MKNNYIWQCPECNAVNHEQSIGFQANMEIEQCRQCKVHFWVDSETRQVIERCNRIPFTTVNPNETG